VDFTRVTQLELNLVQQKDILAQAKADIAQGPVQVYKALGGGWQIKCTGCEVLPLDHSEMLDKPPSQELPAPSGNANNEMSSGNAVPE
jgi:hypothetical protein